MRILPLQSSYPTRNANTYKRNTRPVMRNTPAFQGALNNKQAERVLNMLSEKNTEVIDKFTPQILKNTMDNLFEKYQHLNSKSLGIYVVGKEDLPKFLGENAAKYDTKNKFGVCIAIGDTYGPVESWTKAYEGKTILIPENMMKVLSN